MRGLHLKQIQGIWHYQRRRPVRYADIEPRELIRFSLHTRDFAEAKLLASQVSRDFDRDWRDAQARGVSLTAQDAAERYRAAVSGSIGNRLPIREPATERRNSGPFRPQTCAVDEPRHAN